MKDGEIVYRMNLKVALGSNILGATFFIKNRLKNEHMFGMIYNILITNKIKNNNI
jgi:hypothetical protein